MINKYLIQLNVGKTIYNISATSAEDAYKTILEHEKFYNPEWGYKLLNNKLQIMEKTQWKFLYYYLYSV